MIVYAVDDEEYIREIFELNFKQYKDINLSVFSAAADLLAAVKKIKPDIIVSDIIMPDIGGLELCRIIKSQPEYQNIYFILLTAKISIDDKLAGFETGADDYITKPFKFKELVARIRVGGRLVQSTRENIALIEELKSNNRKLNETNLKLQNTTAKLINSERLNAIGKISSIIAHELKNPLFAISSGLYNLKTENIVRPEDIRILEDHINYCVELIDNITAYNKTGELALENISLAELLDNALINLKIPNYIEIDYSIPESIYLRIDKFQMKIVIMNILKNAIEKFSAENTGKIKITAQVISDTVKIDIKDDGRPLPDGLDIFEPFVTDKAHGTGLGLAFSKQIIENHNGLIYAENLKHGVSIIIELPICF